MLVLIALPLGRDAGGAIPFFSRPGSDRGEAMTKGDTFSFYQRICVARGLHHGQSWTCVLVLYGIVTLFPSPIAALLEWKVSATTVISVMPLLLAVFAIDITDTVDFSVYSVSGALLGFTILFAHTYASGLRASGPERTGDRGHSGNADGGAAFELILFNSCVEPSVVRRPFAT
ncbi:hypothetical protein AB3X96_41395 [Paraburkholderia sp. BR13439]